MMNIIKGLLIIDPFIAAISITITIMTFVYKFIKTVRNNPDTMIKQYIFNREKEIIREYFQSLSEEEIIDIKNNNCNIDSNIYKLIEKHSEINIINSLFNEISRSDRYTVMEKVLVLIDGLPINSSKPKRTLKLIFIIFCNYIFYASKLILSLFTYFIIIYITLVPLYIIYNFLYKIYSFIGSFLFFIFLMSISFLFVYFGEINKRE